MKRYVLDGIVYDSKSEAVVGGLFQRYVPGFHPPIEGKNLHVQCSNTNFDFLLNGVIVEWHPIDRWESNKHYIKRKSLLLAQSEYREHEMIIVMDVKELYESVLQRFGKGVPSAEAIYWQFESIKSTVRTANKMDLERLSSLRGKNGGMQ